MDEAQYNYMNDVIGNVLLIAGSDIPGHWLDPQSGKALYNEAFVQDLERQAREKLLDEQKQERIKKLNETPEAIQPS